MDGEARYHLELEGKREGPFTRVEVLSLWRRGQVDGTTAFWHEGMNQWGLLAAVRSEIAVGEGKLPRGPEPPLRTQPKLVRKGRKLSGGPQSESGSGPAASSRRAAERSHWYPSSKKRLICLLLLGLLGWMGVHYLYADRTGRFWGYFGLLGATILLMIISRSIDGSMEIRYLCTLLSYVGVIAVYAVLMVDLVQVLYGTFRDGEGCEISEWT